MLSVFCSPSRYVQGAHATLKLGEELVFLGFEPPALIIASKAAAETLHEKWKKTFSSVNFSYFVYPFGGECSLKEIDNIKTYAEEKKAKIIIGAGGGKVLDASRAAAADLLLPIVNCPTIASSDAPLQCIVCCLYGEGRV